MAGLLNALKTFPTLARELARALTTPFFNAGPQKMRGICLCCIQNYGLKQFLTSSAEEIVCAECRAENVLGTPEAGLPAQLYKYFNFVSHKVGYYMAGNKYLAVDYVSEFSNHLNVSTDLEADLRKIHRLFRISVIHGSPRLFIYGVFNKMDIHNETFSDEICDEIFQTAGRVSIPVGFKLFRIRKDLISLSPEQFDSAPANAGMPGRFDLGNTQVFYCSDDIKTCVYEARMLAGDDATLATYHAAREIKLLDLTVIDEREGSPHQSVELILFALTNSRYSHKNLQVLSRRALDRGLQGIKYRSFYSQVCESDTHSYVIFGAPLATKLLDLQSLNQVNLRKIDIKYDLGFSSEDFLFKKNQG